MAQLSAPQSFIITSQAKLPDLELKNGRMIFVKDSMKIYYDWDGKRITYSDIVELPDDASRVSLTSPLETKTYFVSSTCELWRYLENKWVQISSKPNVIFKGSPIDLPTTDPQSNTLYIAGKQLYMYDDDQKVFVEIAKDNFTWGSF